MGVAYELIRRSHAAASFAPLSAAASVPADLYFSGSAPAGALFDFPKGTLLHAGPPLSAKRRSRALMSSAIAAACAEGLADDPVAAAGMIEDGDIALQPAQDFDVVTRVDSVVGPSCLLAGVANRDDPTRRALSPVPGGAVDLSVGEPVTLDGCLAAAASKCLLRAFEALPGSTFVTSVASNGTAIGLQLSGLGRQWLTTDDLWLGGAIMRLQPIPAALLADGDWLIRHALLLRGRVWHPYDASDWLYGRGPVAAEALRGIPASLFSMALAKVRPFHWALFLPPH